MENETDPHLSVDNSNSTGSTQDHFEYDESKYSIFYSLSNPNSSLYTSSDPTSSALIFYIEGIAVTFISFLGLIGNILSIIVLSSRRMRSPATYFLLCLAVCDFGFLVGAMFLIGIPTLLAWHSYSSRFIYNYGLVAYLNVFPYIPVFWMTAVASSGSVFFTAALSMERYIAVCKPIYAKFFRTWRRNLSVSLIIFGLAILNNLPRFLEYTYVIDEVGDYMVRRPIPTSFRRNQLMDIYLFRLCYCMTQIIIPICLLIVVNGLTYWKIRDANRLRKSMSMSTHSKTENSLTRMLFGVVIVFLACLTVPALPIFYRYAVEGKENISGEYIWKLTLVVNSSVNFLIYCAAGERFRKVFCSIFCCRGKENRSTQQSSIVTASSSNRTILMDLDEIKSERVGIQ